MLRPVCVPPSWADLDSETFRGRDPLAVLPGQREAP